MADEIKTEVTPEEKPLSPSEYFDILNKKAQQINEDDLRNLYNNAMALMTKYKITGQKSGAIKLYNFAKLCEAEIKVVHAGYTIYVNRQDLDEYITKIAQKTVVIGALEDYERDVPDDVVEKIADAKAKNLFDGYYIVFTDYTGTERKKVDASRREKDPILFGVLKIGNQVGTRLYHIASWEDEYCDLTLDRMVKEYDAKHGTDGDASMQKSLTDEFGSLDDFKRAFNKYNG